MALLDKIFSTKRKLDYVDRGSRNWARSCEITPEQVRLLLFKECDWRGRKVLFDSSTIERIPADKNGKPDQHQKTDIPCIVEVADGYSYVYKGPAADASVLGDMIFGAVAMNFKNVSLKIHIMNDPKRFMCTKVFCVPMSRRISRVERKTSETNNNVVRNSSTPLNVPSWRGEEVSLSFSIDRGDSGFYSEQSPFSSVGSNFEHYSMYDTGDRSNTQDELSFHCPSGRKLSVSSTGSWQRRTFQSMATRFDLGSSSFLSVPNTASSDSQMYSNSTTSGTSDSLLSATSGVAPRRNKLGLALLITVPDSSDMDFIRRCVEHSPQLQALVCRLRAATMAAGAGGNFVSTLHKATRDAARWLSDLMYGPRLQSSWLSLLNCEPRSCAKQSESLLSDICAVLTVGDTKDTNFFISTLLTNVLTYHLGWVTTVSPYDAIALAGGQAKPSGKECRRPYNALWAQLGDLCGSIGCPPRAARTIIAGTTNAHFINKLLTVLTYFVRCGDVTRTDFAYKDCDYQEGKVKCVNVAHDYGLGGNESCGNSAGRLKSPDSLKVPSFNTQSSGSSVSTLVSSEVSLKRSATLSNFNDKLSNASEPAVCSERSVAGMRRNPTVLISLKGSDSSLDSSGSDLESENKVVFVLGEDEKLVGLKNKSNGGRSVKKSSNAQKEGTGPVAQETCSGARRDCARDSSCGPDSPSKCCRQTLQHSKPIKHSGFKFEFDKYPQIVTNYMKSKNLEILDRHYIGKPGNLKLDNFQFDPTIVPPIQEERCDTCYKCQLMESLLQTPTNASEMEYMNDMPRQSEPQVAKEVIVGDEKREMSPKTFVRKRKENTIIVNFSSSRDNSRPAPQRRHRQSGEKPKETVDVKQVLEFPLPSVCCRSHQCQMRSGFDASLLGGLTEHYIPDLILQGTISNPKSWETELRRDLDLTSYLNKTLDTPMQAVAIVGDTNTWEVRVVGRDCGWGGLSPLVGGMLDALPLMRHAKVPAYQCIQYLEGKLRELCVLSKTLADLLMTTDFCDIASLTKSLNIDVNDVPLLLAVATTHTPQLANRYGISYR
ncbi:PREDICTED: folliculin-interacting protein 2 isoform X1 [Papilio xuthus]|uniref:Folliculin-interacting protein 2 isoform X1 n=1 Tax=Papilio xuthus TaxID=66420 RepID=A0AAJ6ZRS1_PAPXU|nr:PREDICTED: folliculin-interacting protein 2 isoform X1 [Papilio xuthus]